MLNSKYSKVLTVVLIVAIVAIIGLLIFVGIDWYKSYTINSDVDEFFNQYNDIYSNNDVANNSANNEQNNETNNETIEPIVNNIGGNTATNTQGGNNNNGGSTSKTPTYKGFNVAGTIEIPKTNVRYLIILQSTATQTKQYAIDVSITVLYGAGVNQVGNTVLAGHNYKNGIFFSNNKKLSNGDKIYITDNSGKKVTYEIYKKYTVDENNFEYAERDTKGKREISLTTCTDDSKNRLIIWAKEV